MVDDALVVDEADDEVVVEEALVVVEETLIDVVEVEAFDVVLEPAAVVVDVFEGGRDSFEVDFQKPTVDWIPSRLSA